MSCSPLRRARSTIFCLLTLAAALPARAATFIVSTPADSGFGSLRDAVTQANTAGGTNAITFDSNLAGQTITLTSAGDNTYARHHCQWNFLVADWLVAQ